MILKRVPLPSPPFELNPEEIVKWSEEEQHALVRELQAKRDRLDLQLGITDAFLAEYAYLKSCGGTDDTKDVEFFEDTAGFSAAFVREHSRPVAMLQWDDDLRERFKGPSAAPGNVSGLAWGTGVLIGPDLLLTAGHCFDQRGNGFKRPARDSVTISPNEIASLIRVIFNFQRGWRGEERVTDEYRIAELVEHSEQGVDYAIVRLELEGRRRAPGELYGTAVPATNDLRTPDTPLCIIQHPRGRKKRVGVGPLVANRAGRISHLIDTDHVSSGAPILSADGELVGVHTNGGCGRRGNPNTGYAIGIIRQASDRL